MSARSGALRVVFAGGGTGGHVYPALALARELERGGEGVEILFLGTRRGLEATAVPRAGFPLRTLPGGGVRRRGPLGAPLAMIRLGLGVLGALGVLLEFRPHVVVGTGGYASAAGGLAAVLLRRKLLLQEQNAVPGMTNRLLGRFAAEIHVAFRGAVRVFGPRATLSGNPVRPEILEGWRAREATTRPGGEAAVPRLLVFGGSQGASSINRAAIELARTLAPRGETRFHILAGPRHFEAVVRSLAGVEGVRVEAYSEDMASAYGEADLALCRAGALTIAELALFGLPAILIPYPHAADDHQRRNAEEVVAADGALLIPDERLGEPEALEAIGSLLRDPGRRAAMARGARSLAHPDAAGRIAEAIRTLAGWTGRAAGGISLAAAL